MSNDDKNIVTVIQWLIPNNLKIYILIVEHINTINTI